MSDTEKFIPGLYFNLPRDGVPEYVLGALKIEPERIIEWAKRQSGPVYVDLKRSQEGQGYAQINDWKPKGGGTGPTKRAPDPRKAEEVEDDIPFIRCDSAF
jgi:hypothetical protein